MTIECPFCGELLWECDCDETGHPWTTDGAEDDYSEESYP